MKAGDLVKFHDRLGEAPMIAGAIAGRVYLVLRRDAQNMYKKYDDDSKWAAWHIIDLETGQIFKQIGKDLHKLRGKNER